MAEKSLLFGEEQMRRTNRGDLVRSRSEEIIADKMHERKIGYVYEQPLSMITGRMRYPDFTIADRVRRITYYWEHFRTLDDPPYREHCRRKRAQYVAAGIRPWQEGGGSH